VKRLIALLAAAAAGFVLGAMWNRGAVAERAARPAPPVHPREVAAGPAGAAPAAERAPAAAAPPTAPAARPGLLPMQVEVVDETGSPVALATVTLRLGDQERGHEWTPESPVLFAAPGAYQVHAGTRDGLRSPSQLVWLRPADAPPRVTLALEGGPCIRGRVILPAGFDAEVSVYALLCEGEEPSDKVLRTKGKGRTASANTGYRFAFVDLAPGVYAVGARYRMGVRPLAVRTTVTVDDGTVEVELAFTDPPAAQGTTVRVLDPSGTPCTDIELSGGFIVDGRVDIGYLPVGRRADGFWILQPASDSLRNRPGGCREVVKVRSPLLGETYAEVTPGGDVRLAEPAWLEIRAVPHEGIRVHSALDVDALGRWQRISTCDGLTADGRQGMGPLQPGTYRLVAMAGRAAGQAGIWPVEMRQLRLNPGAREIVTLAIPRSEHTLRVQAPVGRDTWRIDLTRRLGDSGGRASRSVAGGAIAEFTGLPAGTYVLEVPDASAQREVEVPADGIVQFP